MKKTLLKTQFIAVLFLLIGKTTFAQWSNVNPINPNPRFRAATFVIGDTAYLANGHNPGYTTDVRAYTQNSNTWVQEHTYPGGGGDQGFYFTINDTGYVGAGANPGYNNDFYSYTPATGWSYIGAPPGLSGNSTRIFSVGFSIGSKGYMGTGFNDVNTSLNDFWQYDSYTKTWTQKAPVPVGRAGGVAFSVNGKGYIGLGYASNTGNEAVLNDMYQYDPGTDTWDTMASMPPFGEAEAAYFVLCGKLFVVSGLTVHNATVATQQTWMFDPANGPKGTWTHLPDFPGTAAYSPNGFTMGDTGFVYGGDIINTGTALSQMWRYTPNLTLALASASDTVVCPGTAVTLNASGGATYAWSTTAGSLNDTTGIANYDSTSSFIVSPIVTTTYYYTATGNACFSASDSLVVKVNSSAVLTVEPQSPKACNGQSVSLSVPVSGTNYVWSPSTTLSSSTADSVLASPITTTTYTVTGNDSAGCQVSGTDTVFVVTAPPLIIEPQSPKVCSGQGVTLSVPVSGKEYTWIPSTGLNFTTGDSVIATTSVTSIYAVTGTDSVGCVATGTDSVYIIPALPLIILPQPPPSFCSGSNAELKVKGGGTNFTWIPSTGLSATTGDSVLAGPTLTTTYTVSGNDSLGCASTGTEKVIVFPAPIIPTFTQNGNTLKSSAQYQNQWYLNDTLLVGDTSQYLTITVDGKYKVSVTNEANGCSSASDSANITAGINQLSIISDQLSIYPNPFNSTIVIKINSSAQDAKDWNLQVTDVLGRTVYSLSSLKYSNNIDLSNLASGMYFITVINKTGRAVVPVVRQ